MKGCRPLTTADDPEVHPQVEDYRGNVNTTGPRACYDEGKRVAETLVSDYRRQEEVDTKIVRIFNTYGPNMAVDDGRVISNFIMEALRNRPLTLYGDGSQTRSFCFVSDLVDGLVRLMATESTVAGPINMGSPNEQTITSVAEQVIECCDSKSVIIRQELPEDDPHRRCPNITLAKKTLDWEPKVAFRDGLNKTVAYFREL